MGDSREDNVYLAKLCERAERYDEMVEAMNLVAKMDVELTVEERNLLSVAYKNVVGARRSSWRAVTCKEQVEENKGNEARVAQIKEYRAKIETEISSLCNDLLAILARHVIPSATTGESKVFFSKMKGDYWRYLAEIADSGAQREEASEQAFVAYQAGQDMASSDLPTTHPIRLGLALNVAVFYYEVFNAPDRARRVAKQAFDDAVCGLEALDEESEAYRDSTLILQLLRDHIPVLSFGED